MIDRKSFLWNYLSNGQKGLIETGEFLLGDANKHEKPLSDYSYIVFPFAKAYEGFLKQLFLDKGFIDQNQYQSDHFRIGKALNPNFAKEVPSESVYLKITNFCKSEELSKKLWGAWKRGRNLLFHYFPHNIHAITFLEAQDTINMVISAMDEAIVVCKPVGTLLR